MRKKSTLSAEMWPGTRGTDTVRRQLSLVSPNNVNVSPRGVLGAGKQGYSRITSILRLRPDRAVDGTWQHRGGLEAGVGLPPVDSRHLTPLSAGGIRRRDAQGGGNGPLWRLSTNQGAVGRFTLSDPAERQAGGKEERKKEKKHKQLFAPIRMP